MTERIPAKVAARMAGASRRATAAMCALSGAWAALGQAPFGLWGLTLAGFALIAFLVAVAASPKAASWRAWVAGAAYFAVSLHWIVEPFFVDASRHGWMAPFALFLMSGGLALFWALPGWFVARVVAPGRVVPRIVGLVGLLSLAEAARGVILTGFPWAQPGHVLIDTGMLQLAALVGPLGLTVVVLGAAGLLAALLVRAGAAGAVVAWALLSLAGWAVPTVPAPEAPADAPVVRLVQPNAPQHLKWRRDMIPVFFQRGLDLTSAAADPELGAPALVVWPETSLPQLLDRSDTARESIAQAAGGARVAVGAQALRAGRPVNALAILGEDGGITAIYEKHHLVPFGEYLPFGDWLSRFGLRGLAEALPGGYVAGDGPRLLSLGGGLGTVFPMICYEAIFPRYLRHVGERPDWVLHVTNDAWFGTFSGPYQHLALARLRAAEQGLPVLRAANTGISAVIDAHGQIAGAIALGEAGYLDTPLPAATEPTVFSRSGSAPALLLSLFLVLGGLFPVGRSYARKLVMV